MAFKEVKLTAINDVKIAITYRASPMPVLAVYDYDLKTSDANPPIEHKKGDNQNTKDDRYSLPTPIDTNKDRYILISSEIAAIDTDSDFDIIIEIFQDGFKTDTLTDSGSVKGDGPSVGKIDMIKFK